MNKQDIYETAVYTELLPSTPSGKNKPVLVPLLLLPRTIASTCNQVRPEYERRADKKVSSV